MFLIIYITDYGIKRSYIEDVMQKPHRAIAIIGSVCITAAASIEGTLVNKIVKCNRDEVKIAYPGGILKTVAKLNNGKINI